MKVPKRFFTLLCFCLAFSWATSICARPASRVMDHYKRLHRVLGQRQARQVFRKMGKGFGIIALSYAAQGVAQMVAMAPQKRRQSGVMLQKLVRIALHPTFSPYSQPLSRVKSFGPDGLYLTHLAIVLASAARVTKKRMHARLLTRISRHLARRSLAHRTKHVRSYRRSLHRWPADQAATLYALWLVDRAMGTKQSAKPIAAWLRYMRLRATTSKGLHFSNVTKSRAWRIPRGCALSWSVLYMSRFAPLEAKKLYRAYKRSHLVTWMGFAAFREWPRGHVGFSDVDSGPVIRGVGTAATAFGIGAARVMGDTALLSKLLRTRQLGLFWAQHNKALRRVSKAILATSITLMTDTLPHP